MVHRSTIGPKNGLRITIGSIPKIVAMLNTVAEPVFLVKYQIVAAFLIIK